jgi:pimeloyl-ACP methyl ester carboxylesterase
MVRVLAKAAILAVVLYTVASAVMAYVIWHPVRRLVHTDPGKYGLAYDTVSFPSADGITLRGWYIDSPNEQTILVLHGSGSVKDNYINMEMSRVLAGAGYDILLFDFRGHGESDGSIFSLGKWETRDIAGALAYLDGRGMREVGVLAYSMGAATALLAAPDHPQIRAIVADSSFASLSTVIRSEGSKAIFFMPLMYPGVALMSKLMFGIDPDGTQPVEAVPQLGDRPLFLIHSTGDSLIPVSEIYDLEKAGAGNPNLEVWVAQGEGHVSAFANNEEEYVRRVVEFFNKHLKQ